MITVKYNDGGTERSLELLADSFSELTPIFKPFAKYMRREIQQVFQSGGEGEWPKRTEASQARFDESKAGRIGHIEANKYNSLLSSLNSSKRKAEKRLSKPANGDSKLSARRQKSVARYEAQVAEVQRLAAGGTQNPAGQKKLYERVGRRDQRAAERVAAVESGQLLGRIANSFKIDWNKTTWTMQSEVKWAGAQETGATVGHGARLPARPFLYWTPERIEMFCTMARAHMLAAWQKSGDR